MYDATLRTGEVIPHASTPVAVPDDVPSPHGSSPRSIWGVVRRHLALIGAAGVLATGATWIVTSRLRPVYAASATFRIDTKQRGLGIQELLRLDGGNEVKTEMEVLRSRLLAGGVVDSLGLQLRVAAPVGVPSRELVANVRTEPELHPASYVLRRASDGSFIARAYDGGRPQRVRVGESVTLGGATLELLPAALQHAVIEIQTATRDAAIDSLQATLKVSRRGRDADILEVYFEGHDRQIVRDVPNVLLAKFLARRRTVQQTETRGAVVFLREQLVGLATQLGAAEDSMRDFRERSGVVSLPDQATGAVRRAADLHAQRDAIEVERVGLQSLMDEATTAVARDPGLASAAYRKLAGFPTMLRSQAVVGLLGALQEADDRRAEMLTRRRPEDADVQLLTARVHDVETQLATITATYLQGLTSQAAALDRELDEAGRDIDRIPAEQVQFARLDRQTRILDGVFTLFQSRLKEAELAEAAYDPSVRVIDTATLPSEPIRPKPLINLVLALVAGLGLGTAAAFAHDFADRSVHTRHDLLVATGMPVLGLIPSARPAQRRLLARRGGAAPAPNAALLLGNDPAHSQLAEAYQWLDASLNFARPDAPYRMLVVTSALPGDGKTTSAVNLALTLARRGRRVLLVDADLRRGRVADALGISPVPGFSELLRGQAVPQAVLHTLPLGSGAELVVLPAGAAPAYPAQLLASPRTHEVLGMLSREYDVIVLDTPPVNVLADAALLAAQSDGVIVVARAGSTPADALAFAVEQLRIARAPVLGALLNDIDISRDGTYDAVYRFYRHTEGASAS
jgi:succinoglycan biosynthesis transport protein ExoP